MRAVTKTTLSLGDLLEIPISICAATGAEDVKFTAGIRLGTEPDADEPDEQAETVALEAPDAEGDEEAEAEPTAVFIKGLKVGDDLREVPDCELDWAAAVTKLDRVQVLEFCDYRRVPTDRLAGSFWIQPDPAFSKPLATLMCAMRESGRAMVVKYNLKSRQRLGVIRVRKVGTGPHDFALLLNSVVYAHEWRKPDGNVLRPGAELESVDPRAIQHALELIRDLHGDGSSLTDATDGLVVEHTQIAARAIDGVYDDPARVLRLAGDALEQGYRERANRLAAYVAERWPEHAVMTERVEAILATGGEDVGGKLAALIG